MNTGDALEAAMRNNPNDSTPRLVYADYLDEVGNATGAAFLRGGLPCIAVERIERGDAVELVSDSIVLENRKVRVCRGSSPFGTAQCSADAGGIVGVW